MGTDLSKSCKCACCGSGNTAPPDVDQEAKQPLTSKKQKKHNKIKQQTTDNTLSPATQPQPLSVDDNRADQTGIIEQNVDNNQDIQDNPVDVDVPDQTTTYDNDNGSDNGNDNKNDIVASDKYNNGTIWYDEMAEVSDFIGNHSKIDLKSSEWSKVVNDVNIKAKMDGIIMSMGTFIGEETTFDTRMTIWEGVDNKSKKLNVKYLEKLLYQCIVHYLRQKDKKKQPPKYKDIKALMTYIAKHIKELDAFNKNTNDIDKVDFARNMDNWMMSIVDNYFKN